MRFLYFDVLFYTIELSEAEEMPYFTSHSHDVTLPSPPWSIWILWPHHQPGLRMSPHMITPFRGIQSHCPAYENYRRFIVTSFGWKLQQYCAIHHCHTHGHGWNVGRGCRNVGCVSLAECSSLLFLGAHSDVAKTSSKQCGQCLIAFSFQPQCTPK